MIEAAHLIHPDWEARLIALIEERQDMPFAWGIHDCVLWAAAAVEAMTGARIELLGDPPSWSGPEGALRAIRRTDAADLAELADRALGERFGPLRAGVGWIVAAPSTEGEAAGGAFGLALGVMWRGAALFAGADGLLPQPPARLVASWQPWGHLCRS